MNYLILILIFILIILIINNCEKTEHFAQKKTCDRKDQSLCIFKDYYNDGKNTCISPTNAQDNYSVSALASYNDTPDFRNWLDHLYNRNAGSDPSKNEKSNVEEYRVRCVLPSSTPSSIRDENSYLIKTDAAKNLLLNDVDSYGRLPKKKYRSFYLRDYRNSKEGVPKYGFSDYEFKSFDYLNYWDFTINFNLNRLTKSWQGIIGNMYNLKKTVNDGWGFWISPSNYIHFRINEWAEDLTYLGKVDVNIEYVLIINFINGTYKITLGNVNNKPADYKTMIIQNKPKLFTIDGLICIGGDWDNYPIEEKLQGRVISVEFDSPQLQSNDNLQQPSTAKPLAIQSSPIQLQQPSTAKPLAIQSSPI